MKGSTLLCFQDSVTAIPLEDWNLDYIVPRILCTTQDDKCIPSLYPVPDGAVQVDAAGDDAAGRDPPNILDPAAKPRLVQGGVRIQLIQVIRELMFCGPEFQQSVRSDWLLTGQFQAVIKRCSQLLPSFQLRSSWVSFGHPLGSS